MYGHQFLALEGKAFRDVFGEEAEFPSSPASVRDCQAVCLELGTLKSVVARPLPHRYWGREEAKRQLYDFMLSDSCGRVEYGFVNYQDNPIKIYWINENTGEKVFNAELEKGERHTNFISTFIGHKFVFEDAVTGEQLEELIVPSHGIIGIGNHVQPHVPREGVPEEVYDTLRNEWKRHSMIKRTFSPLAFDKGRLPDDLYASLSAYYYNNRDPPHRVLEEWGRHKGVFVNYWETDVNFIQIPWKLKSRWQGRLKDLVEAWTGVELETTDMYGMRRYEKGARLLTHVDRHTTHAASLIVNIAQENVTRPWTIEVHDHADRLHEVVMQPGDIVYYESAKALHGRNTPLQSGSYINLFTHYRPLNDPDWWQRDNPEGTPEPLIDVGECKLVGELDQYGQGAVKCDNPAIGPNLSPTMFKAESGEDLFDWWKRVGPKDGAVVDGVRGGEEL